MERCEDLVAAEGSSLACDAFVRVQEISLVLGDRAGEVEPNNDIETVHLRHLW